MKKKTDSHLCSMDTFVIHRYNNLSLSQLDGRKSSRSQNALHTNQADLYHLYVLTPESTAFILA